MGSYGSLYEIQEQDALEWIAQKLTHLQETGELEKQQNLMKVKASKRIYRPKPVKELKKAVQSRTFIHDLTIVVPEDIVDADGKVIYPKGTRINPLAYSKSHKALAFLDGDDEKQVKWALQLHEQKGDLVKLVLVNGPIIELMEETLVCFYFDQEGRLIKRFQIEHIPAIVEQKGDKLVVSEIKI